MARRSRHRNVSEAAERAPGVRAFLAVEPSDEARQAAAQVAHALHRRDAGGAVRWVRPEAMHVTLRFLGRVALDRIAPLTGALTRRVGGIAPFELQLGPVLGLPGPSRPRVIAIGLQPEQALAGLAAEVERGVVDAGFEPEPRGFRAHLTLGRVRSRFALAGAPEPEPSPFPVREVVLFRSELHPSGSRYTPLERIALGGDPRPETRASGGA